MSGLPGSTPEPDVLRKVGLGQILPLVVFAVWIALIELTGLDFPLWVIVAAAAFSLVRLVLDTEHVRVDAEGVRVRPAARIPWEQIDAVSYQGPEALGVRLKPGAPLPRGLRGMIDGELTLRTRGAELDRARLARAVAAYGPQDRYADAGGSFSGTPGNGASSSARSAGGPSG